MMSRMCQKREIELKEERKKKKTKKKLFLRGNYSSELT